MICHAETDTLMTNCFGDDWCYALYITFGALANFHEIHQSSTYMCLCYSSLFSPIVNSQYHHRVIELSQATRFRVEGNVVKSLERSTFKTKLMSHISMLLFYYYLSR
jgi:hypothetical protein